MKKDANPYLRPKRREPNVPLADALAELAHSNDQLALFECRLVSDALDHTVKSSSHLEKVRALDVAGRAMAVAICLYEPMKHEPSSILLREALTAVFWKAMTLYSGYLGFDECFDEMGVWLEHLAIERRLFEVAGPIAAATCLQNPEIDEMADVLQEFGFWVSSACGDSHWRRADDQLPYESEVAELTVREQSASLTADVYRLLSDILARLPTREPKSNLADPVP